MPDRRSRRVSDISGTQPRSHPRHDHGDPVCAHVHVPGVATIVLLVASVSVELSTAAVGSMYIGAACEMVSVGDHVPSVVTVPVIGTFAMSDEVMLSAASLTGDGSGEAAGVGKMAATHTVS